MRKFTVFQEMMLTESEILLVRALDKALHVLEHEAPWSDTMFDPEPIIQDLKDVLAKVLDA